MTARFDLDKMKSMMDDQQNTDEKFDQNEELAKLRAGVRRLLNRQYWQYKHYQVLKI